MSEIIAGIFIVINLVYVLVARSKAETKEDKEDLVYTAGHLILARLPDKYGKLLLNQEEYDKLKKLWLPKDLERETKRYLARKIGLVYLVLVLGGFFAIILGGDFIPSEQVATSIDRPTYGEAAETKQLNYLIEGEDGERSGTISVDIPAQVPEGDEALTVLENGCHAIIELMLRGEDTQFHVTQDMNFDKNPFNSPVEAYYSSLTPEYLTDKGEIRTNNMAVGVNYPVSVEVTLALSGMKLVNHYDFEVYRMPLTLDEEVSMVSERIQTDDDRIVLPTELMEQGGHLIWSRPEEGVRGIQIFALAMGLALLLWLFRKESLNKALMERQELILLDFPDVVSKLTLLINAGMTFGRAWQKIVTDYQERGSGKRPLYEEMLTATVQMQNGMPEKEALEAFGRRSGNREVIRMSALLIQNLKRGSHSLTEALKGLSQEAWEIRTGNAKMLGEKASTKLLLPMGISFVTVIIIVIAPTMMSMSL